MVGVKSQSSCTLKLQNFEGPLDLLYHLIEKNKMSIYDICINEIADQYLEYIFSMQKMDLEVASDFLIMASTLLHIKSKLLLPSNKDKSENEEEQLDPKEELMIRIINYKKFKDMAEILREDEKYWTNAIFKAPESIEFVFEPEPINIDSINLKILLLDLLRRKKSKNNEKSSNDMIKIIQYERVSLRSKIREVVASLVNKVCVKFSDVFLNKGKTQLEIVTGFLAILELAKLKKIELFQKETFSEIEIRRKDVSIDIPSDEQVIG